jgi:hypothetical protein
MGVRASFVKDRSGQKQAFRILLIKGNNIYKILFYCEDVENLEALDACNYDSVFLWK